MSSEYSDDQYRADYESRYPQFSDYQVTDTMLAEHRWDRPAKPRGVQTYESKYQTEQIGLPTYIECSCGKCPGSEWPRRLPMRKCSIDERDKAMREQGKCVESMIGAPMSGDTNTVLLVLMFIMFVFIAYCMKSIIELKAQLKSRKNEGAE
jgi:hypothetical protein